MKVLVKVPHKPYPRFLVELSGSADKKRVASLLKVKNYQDAIMTALLNGKFIKAVLEAEVPKIDAELILSMDNAYHDLTCRK